MTTAITNKKAEQPTQHLANTGSTPSPAKYRMFVIYNTYRLVTAVIMLALLLAPELHQLVGRISKVSFIIGCVGLLGSSLLFYTQLGRQICRSETSVFGLLLVDIVLTAAVAHSSGGLGSGFSVLAIFTVASGALLLSTQILAILIAAMATISVLVDTLWLASRGEVDFSLMLPAGILGALFFATSILAQIFARRLEQAEEVAVAAEAQVTALQQLNHQIILHMQTGILLINAELEAKPINAAAQRLLQLSANGQTSLDTISSELAEQFKEWLEGAGHRPTPFSLGRNRPPLVASFAILDELSSEYLIFIDDYTPATQYAQSLKIDSMRKLTASIAHEIRNPLSAISHAAQLLNESDTIPATDSGLCDIVIKNAKRVNNIIENVMEVSRRQAPNQRSVLLHDWLGEFVGEYRSHIASDANIELDLNASNATANLDTDHFRRVLSNLCDNALRHSQEDAGTASCTIKMSLVPQRHQALIDVIDTGHGVTEENIPRLFEPFYTTSSKGTGLGLYLCRELCEINGATLNYQRTRAGASAFRITLRIEDVSE